MAQWNFVVKLIRCKCGKLEVFRSGRLFFQFLLPLIFIFNSWQVLAEGNYGVTYQGRITNKEGQPLVAPSVKFLVWINAGSPGSSECILYSEKFSNDMSDGTGGFSIVLGMGQRTDSSTFPFENLFNPALKYPAMAQCSGGFNKKPGDKLYLNVAFNPGDGFQTLAPAEITATPYSFDTVQVAGVPSTNVLRFTDVAATPLAQNQYYELLALLNGTSTKYAQPGGSGTDPSKLPLAGGTMGGVLNMGGNDLMGVGHFVMAANKTLLVSNNSSNPTGMTGADKGRFWFDSVSNRLKYFDGTNVQSLAVLGDASNIDWSNITSGKPTTLAGYGITDAVLKSGDTMTGPLNLPTNGLIVGSSQLVINNGVGVGTTSPTAKLHLAAGTAAAGTAPLKLTAGTNLTTPEPGAIEFDGTSLFYTTSGGVRQTLGTAGAGITALTGDVSASGSGSVAATVNSVGGSTAANINTATVAVNTNATSASTASVLVKRDTNGVSNFKGLKLDGATSGTLTQTVPATVTSYSLTWPSSVAGTANSVLASDASGNLSWINLGSIAGSVSLTSQVSGVLPIANGGTNSSTALVNNQLMYSASGAIRELGAMTDGQVIVGKASSAPQIVTMGGDVTINNVGSTTVGKIGGTTVTGVGLANNNLLQNNSGSAITANNILVSNGTATGVTAIPTTASSMLVSSAGSVPQWSALSGDHFTQYALLAG